MKVLLQINIKLLQKCLLMESHQVHHLLETST